MLDKSKNEVTFSKDCFCNKGGKRIVKGRKLESVWQTFI